MHDIFNNMPRFPSSHHDRFSDFFTEKRISKARSFMFARLHFFYKVSGNIIFNSTDKKLMQCVIVDDIALTVIKNQLTVSMCGETSFLTFF